MIRSENREINLAFQEVLTKRDDLRIGQMIYLALRDFRIEKDGDSHLENALFGMEDDSLIRRINDMLVKERKQE